MKFIPRFLFLALTLVSGGANAAPVATTAGSNLTAYNGSSGSANNNNWNNMTNGRGSGGTSAPVADFGNCNALIMRCAQPRCASGGCTDMDVASSIVSGCVMSNEACKKHGDDLIQYISAQLVANSNAQANQQAAAQQAAAAEAAAQQSAAQMQAMQEQMRAMQEQMTQQNAAAQQQLQEALAQQQQLTAQALAEAQSAAQSKNSTSSASANSVSAEDQAISKSNDIAGVDGDLTTAQRIAAENNISADIIMRADISGQVLTNVENAEKSLAKLKQTMETTFTYAGCDSRGNNCTGPKRVVKFKELASQFFEPYNTVLDEMYEALITAQSVGADLSNIYMLLNDSCNQWGQYMCTAPANAVEDPTTKDDKNATEKKWLYRWPVYEKVNCPDGKSKNIAGSEERGGTPRGGFECTVGQTIPPEDDSSCTLINLVKNVDPDDPIKRSYLFTMEGDYGDNIRVGCASSMINNSKLFRNRKAQTSIDVEILERILQQDSININVRNKTAFGEKENVKYCALTEGTYAQLQKYVAMRGMPRKDICINERKLNQTLNRTLLVDSDSIIENARKSCETRSYKPEGHTDSVPAPGIFSEVTYQCYCFNVDGQVSTQECDPIKSKQEKNNAEKQLCTRYGATWDSSNAEKQTCRCNTAPYDEDKTSCAYKFDQSTTGSGNLGISEAQARELCNKTNGTFVDLFSCKCGDQEYNPTYASCENDEVTDKTKDGLHLESLKWALPKK